MQPDCDNRWFGPMQDTDRPGNKKKMYNKK